MEGAAPQAQPSGPIETAAAWMNAVLRDRSLSRAWPITAQDLRQDMVATWVEANRSNWMLANEDPEAVIEDLASDHPERQNLWRLFDTVGTIELRALWPNVDLDTWGWATDPRPLALDLEAVLLLDAGPLDENNRPLTPGPHPAIAFLMHYADNVWRVSAVTSPDRLPTASGRH